MYEAFFQLNARPFLAGPYADRYYPAASIEQARETATRCVERGEGPAVVLGSAGLGKSILCQVLARQLRNQFRVVVLASARLCTRRALLQNILFELNLPYRDREEGELRLALIDFLGSRDVCPHGMVLVVDEAHMLPLRLLEEVRMITNLVHDGQPQVRLVLAANLTLDERLASPRLESFNQRVAARCYLQSMNREDTCEFIRRQIVMVGGDPRRVFTDDALRGIHCATDGIPRLVNQVCDHALMLAAIGRTSPIDASGVEEAWADLQQLPAPWVNKETAAAGEPARSTLEFGELDDDRCGELDGGGELETHAVPQSASKLAEEAAARLQEVEAAVASIEDDPAAGEPEAQFQPPAPADPEIELVFHHAHNPFNERFEHEEDIIVDPYASLEALGGVRPFRHGHREPTIPFRHTESLRDLVAAGLEDGDPVLPNWALEKGNTPKPRVVNADDGLPGDDRDLLVIHNDLDVAADQSAAPASPQPKRREYRQLFASLRRR